MNHDSAKYYGRKKLEKVPRRGGKSLQITSFKQVPREMQSKLSSLKISIEGMK